MRRIAGPRLGNNIIKDALFNLIKWYVKNCLVLYFGKVEVIRTPDNAEGPVILAANHQNAFLDALLVVCFVRKPIWFLTRADIFKNSILRNILFFFRMLPMYRQRDGKEALQNVGWVEEQCLRLLKRGNWIGVFPEATHDQRWVLRPLTKGTARLWNIALEENMPVRTFCCGIFYYNHTRSGYPVILTFDKGITPDPIAAKPKAKWIAESTKQISDSLSTLYPNVPYDSEYYDEAATLIKNYTFDEPTENYLAFLPELNKKLKKLISGENKNVKVEKLFDNFLEFKKGLAAVGFVLIIPILPWYLLVKFVSYSLVKDKQFVPSIKFAAWAFLWPIYPIALWSLLNPLFGINIYLITLLFLVNVWILCRVKFYTKYHGM
ncbi:MAG: 1-acyl-sn-glycerol-3-phosphate acyltransferase [Luteibaculaceae bacterium]